jgi:hypothetical protein
MSIIQNKNEELKVATDLESKVRKEITTEDR